MSWLPEVFDKAAGRNNSEIALIEEDRKWTFGELAAEVDAIAAMLKEKVPGETVGILLLNSQAYVAYPFGHLESRQDGSSAELSAPTAGAGLHH
jgi:acyl-CoA synthetase (AMP-forming)/AMP-acid ligase II